MTAHDWFEIEDAQDFSGVQLAFATALRAHTGHWSSESVSSEFAWTEDDTLVALVSIIDDNRVVHDFGVHVSGDRVTGDGFVCGWDLPDVPSPRGFTAQGSVDELAKASAAWFESMLRRPVVLYVWLHNKRAYAARYAFADTGKTLSQTFAEKYAPEGAEQALLDGGHVFGKGWLQTAGLPPADVHLRIRGVPEPGQVPAETRLVTTRGPIPGPWYA